MIALGAPLKNLEQYLENNKYKAKNDEQRLALSLPLKTDINPRSTSRANPNKTIALAGSFIDSLPEGNNKTYGSAFLSKIVIADRNEEISQISKYFSASLNTQFKTDKTNRLLRLGSANVFAWIAYTIYDDFIDDEGSSKMLSLANIMHRRAFELYLKEYPNKSKIINNYFNSVDNSNLWELENCRAKILNNKIYIESIPEYNDGEFLAKRSIGHILGPKLLLDEMKTSSIRKNKAHEALFKYLIAKQISDDISDWESDLNNGHLSYVVSRLLTVANKLPGEYNLFDLTGDLRQVFWQEVYEECLRYSVRLLKESEYNLIDSGLFSNDNNLRVKLLNPLNSELDKCLKEHLYGKQFLKTYVST